MVTDSAHLTCSAAGDVQSLRLKSGVKIIRSLMLFSLSDADSQLIELQQRVEV